MNGRIIQWKTLLLAILFSLISLTILSRISAVQLAGIPQAFSQMGRQGLFILLLLFLLSYSADALRLKTLARAGGTNLSYSTACLCALGGSFLTNISPFFLGAGLLYSMMFLLRGLAWPRAVSLMIAGAFFNHMTHFALGLFILLLHTDLPPLLLQARWYLLSIYLAILLLFSLALFFQGRMKELLQGGGYWKNILLQTLQGFTSIWLSGKKNLFLLLTAAVLYFFSFYGVAVIIFKTLIPQAPYLLIYPLQLLSYLFSLPLPTPGATGGVEFFSLSTFSLLAPLSQAGQVVLIWRLVIYYFPLLLGGVALVILSMKEDIKREDLKGLFLTHKRKELG